MKVSVIGGTGHIGKHLTGILVEEGHEVTVMTSGRTPIPEGGPWDAVRSVQMRYGAEGWTDVVAAQEPDAIVDILQSDAPGLYEALKDRCGHFVFCGSIWMFGLPRSVPTPEETQAPCLFDGYDRRYDEMQATRDLAAAEGVAFSAIMCPNICGPGKIPLECAGGRSLDVHKAHKRGDTVILPDPGHNLIGPCDAEDIARAFAGCIAHREEAAGHIFNVGSAYALTALQFVETYGEIYGVELPVELVSWERFEGEVLPQIGANWHFRANMCPDITALSSRTGYRPHYTPEETLERAVRWMFDQGLFED